MIFSLIAFGSAVLAPSDAPKVVGTSMFKNGFAVVTREIPLDAKGRATITTIPQGSLGTLWFAGASGTMLSEVSNVEEIVPGEVSATSFQDFLSMNVGKTATIVTANLGTVTGRIVDSSNDIVLLDVEGQPTMFQRGEIRKLSIPGGVVKRKTESTRRVLRLTGTPSGKAFMVSLERGMTWAPAYSIDVTNPKKLTIVGKATMLNDLADISGVEVRFITGFPNLPFAGLPDPLVSGYSVDQFVGMIGGIDMNARQSFGRGRAGEMMTQNAAAPMMDAGGGFGDSMPISNLPGMQNEELFFYRQPNVTLAKGDRAYTILFKAESEYERLYTWDVADLVQNDTEYRPQPGTPYQPDDVWQSLKFKNTANLPFTTAAATTFKNGEIVGQDMMRYTPPNADTLVRVTKSLDLRAEKGEEEVSRERLSLKLPGDYNYDLVTIKGTLQLTNAKADAVKLKIRKSLTGEVVSADGSPKIIKTAKGLQQLNSKALIEWNTSVEAGKKLNLSYTYKLYVRSY